MKVTEKDVREVAELAHLELTEEEVPRMVENLNSILEDVHRLNELDTSKVEPMTRFGGTAADVMREDRVEPGVVCEDATRNAPESDGTYFRVPKVIER